MSIPESSLHEVPLFAGLSPTQLAELARLSTSRSIPAKWSLLHLDGQSKFVYVLLQGTMKVSVQRSNGCCATLGFMGPGEVLGDLNAIDGQGHSADVVAVKRSQVLCINCDDFCQCLVSMPILNQNLVKVLVRRLRRLTVRVEELATLNLRGRLARQLLFFAEEYGVVQESGGILIPLRLTHKDLASLIGFSRERVSEEINSFRRQNYLAQDSNRYFIICNSAALERQCQ